MNNEYRVQTKKIVKADDMDNLADELDKLLLDAHKYNDQPLKRKQAKASQCQSQSQSQRQIKSII